MGAGEMPELDNVEWSKTQGDSLKHILTGLFDILQASNNTTVRETWNTFATSTARIAVLLWNSYKWGEDADK